MKPAQLAEDIAFLRRRQQWLEKRVKDGGLKTYDQREAHALDRVCEFLELALHKLEAQK